MYSLVIKISILVNKAVDEVNTIPTLELIKPIVEVLFADPDPTKISVITNNTFFLIIDINFFLQFSLSILSDFNMFS